METQTIRRILVALDTSTDSLAALETAVKLAANLQAELVGLFVEDVNLLRLAELPFSRETRYHTTTNLNTAQMEHELRMLASQARRALMEAAEPRSVRWDFRVVRGQVTPEVLTAALEADLLTLGKASRAIWRQRLGSTALAAAIQTQRSVLLAGRSANDHRPVLVTYDGSQAAQQALIFAANLAQANQSPLTILVMAEETAVSHQLGIQAADHLANISPTLPDTLHLTYRHLPHTTPNSLVEAVELEGGGSLVLGGTGEWLQAEAIQQLLDKLDCPVLLVK